ncbi:zf-BED domain-containing protein/DUF659 domain-containing protein/Dimer_Tnp_hAT domain-containing protein [Senna tora]|uniref:Zf-BED domain-containing protein/DUF659 domain-containing protein/Dimer_Tnp_hAT domain-containing protein n=1 Tax=Senna tora TaxID=362788 RepID=A0A834TNU1_9FABA|nr:zf-BED domain-containing protein/DUF659 domain-containing protein/Dimer_Tnp_hAT domain-containing protein [Senna tora]
MESQPLSAFIRTGSGGGSGVCGQNKKRKNALGSRTDIGWQHGYPVSGDRRKVTCKYCGKTNTGGIFRFKHHLACTRENVEPCNFVPDDVRKEMLKILVKSTERSPNGNLVSVAEFGEEEREIGLVLSQRLARSSLENQLVATESTQSPISQLSKEDLREEASRQIARFFYTSAIPLNCVKNPEFEKMCLMIAKHGPGFKPPTFHEVREKFLKQEVEETKNLIEEHKLDWKIKGCSIMSNGWTDKKRRSIVNFLVNSPKGTVFLSSRDVSDVSKTAEKIFEMLDEIVEQVGEENVVQVITDNATNYKVAGQMLMEKRRRLFWTPCAAHCIDLMLEDFEERISLHKSTIKKGRMMTTFIYSRTKLISMLKHFTKGKDLIRPAVTRFATTYLTLGCLSDNKMSLVAMFSSTQWKSSRFAFTEDGKLVEQVVMDSMFWENVSVCLKAAYPLIKVLRLVDANDKPAMGFIYEEMDRAKEKIQANFRNVKKSYEPIWKIIDERWEAQLHNPLYTAAYYLNPQFHYSPKFKAKFKVKHGLYKCMDRMLTPEDKDKVDSQLEMFKEAKGLFGIRSAKSMSDKKQPTQWWDSYGDECPELQKFAIRILSLTCSSLGCERNSSAFEMVHKKRRNWLHQKKMNDLVFVMYNQILKNKNVRELDDLDNISSDDEWITEDDVAREEEEGEDVAFEMQNLEEMKPCASVDDLEIHENLGDSNDVDTDNSCENEAMEDQNETD